MTSAERFGARLREWRQRRRISQEVLGAQIGADGPRIHRLEKGGENPTLDTLDRLASALKIDASDFLAPSPEGEPGRVTGGPESIALLGSFLASRFPEDAAAQNPWQRDVLRAVAILIGAINQQDASDESAAPSAKTGS